VALVFKRGDLVRREIRDMLIMEEEKEVQKQGFITPVMYTPHTEIE